MTAALLVVVAYVLGATPSSHWVAKGLYGVDLRSEGSGNLGATNTFRILGARAAAPVMLIDIAKGWLPVWLFPALDGTPNANWALAYAAAAVVGHVYSFWVGFRGGKGIATSAGAFLALAPWAVLLGLAVWLATLAFTRIVSVGSLAAAVALTVGVAWLPHRGGDALLPFTLALAAFAFWTHRSNLGRLMRGEETQIRRGSGGANRAGGTRPAPEERE